MPRETVKGSGSRKMPSSKEILAHFRKMERDAIIVEPARPVYKGGCDHSHAELCSRGSGERKICKRCGSVVWVIEKPRRRRK